MHGHTDNRPAIIATGASVVVQPVSITDNTDGSVKLKSKVDEIKI